MGVISWQDKQLMKITVRIGNPYVFSGKANAYSDGKSWDISDQRHVLCYKGVGEYASASAHKTPGT